MRMSFILRALLYYARLSSRQLGTQVTDKTPMSDNPRTLLAGRPGQVLPGELSAWRHWIWLTPRESPETYKQGRVGGSRDAYPSRSRTICTTVSRRSRVFIRRDANG